MLVENRRVCVRGCWPDVIFNPFFWKVIRNNEILELFISVRNEHSYLYDNFHMKSLIFRRTFVHRLLYFDFYIYLDLVIANLN